MASNQLGWKPLVTAGSLGSLLWLVGCGGKTPEGQVCSAKGDECSVRECCAGLTCESQVCVSKVASPSATVAASSTAAASSTSGASTTASAAASSTGAGSTSSAAASSSSGASSTGTASGGSLGSTSGGSTGSTSGTSGSNTPFLTIPLSGCPLNYYYAPVTVGDQQFTMVFDTGSPDTAIALSSCSTCGVSSEFSAPSGTCSGETQELFGTGSDGWTASVCSESVSVGGEMPTVTVDIAGITSNMDFFNNFDCTQTTITTGDPKYQGILGMSPLNGDTIGDAGKDAYFSELVANGVTDKFATLLCSVGGLVWFGGYDPSYASGQPQYTPLGSNGYWTVSVSSIGLGGTNLGGADANSVVDTGTQFYAMPTAAFNAFIAQTDSAFTTIFGADNLNTIFSGNTACVEPVGGQTQAEIDAALPPMTITLPSVSSGSFTLSFPATASYLVPATGVDGGAVQYCLAIGDNSEIDGLTILGGPMLRANITLFDLGNSQVGFIPQSVCK